jgi:hypothetical protein
MNSSLTLLSIDHGVGLGVLGSTAFLVDLRLLLLLNQIAEGTAAGGGNVSDARSLEIVLVADVHALHRLWDPMETEAHGSQEEKALAMH